MHWKVQSTRNASGGLWKCPAEGRALQKFPKKAGLGPQLDEEPFRAHPTAGDDATPPDSDSTTRGSPLLNRGPGPGVPEGQCQRVPFLHETLLPGFGNVTRGTSEHTKTLKKGISRPCPGDPLTIEPFWATRQHSTTPGEALLRGGPGPRLSRRSVSKSGLGGRFSSRVWKCLGTPETREIFRKMRSRGLVLRTPSLGHPTACDARGPL